jgi:hypothetical protein
VCSLPAPIVETIFESHGDFPNCIVESMRAVDGTILTFSLRDLGPPKAYVRAVNERLTEVGAFAVPAEFSLEINGVVPVGQPEAGPLAEAPRWGPMCRICGTNHVQSPMLTNRSSSNMTAVTCAGLW